jgi:hypothetical protein
MQEGVSMANGTTENFIAESVQGMPESNKLTVLLLCPDIHLAEILHKVLEQGGYLVETVHHELVASLKIASRHYCAVVVDFCDQRSVKEALRFCEQVKSLRSDQCFVLRAGHWQYVPENACPDAAVSKDDGPAALLQQLEELTA